MVWAFHITTPSPTRYAADRGTFSSHHFLLFFFFCSVLFNDYHYHFSPRQLAPFHHNPILSLSSTPLPLLLSSIYSFFTLNYFTTTMQNFPSASSEWEKKKEKKKKTWFIWVYNFIIHNSLYEWNIIKIVSLYLL